MYKLGEGITISFEENTEWDRMMASRYPFYVTMKDKFFSGLGPVSHRNAIYVYGCFTAEEAKIVADNARQRGDQERINILRHPPTINPVLSRIKFMEREGTHSNWYKPNFFKEEQ